MFVLMLALSGCSVDSNRNETEGAEGKIRSIGLSNWYIEELEEFLPHYQENDVIPYIQNLGIVVQGYSYFHGFHHVLLLRN